MTNTSKLKNNNNTKLTLFLLYIHFLNMVYYDFFSTFFGHASESAGFMKVTMVTFLFAVIFLQFSRVGHIVGPYKYLWDT